jgi:hypothetical protein
LIDDRSPVVLQSIRCYRGRRDQIMIEGPLDAK